jgi:hypothetical protein
MKRIFTAAVLLIPYLMASCTGEAAEASVEQEHQTEVSLDCVFRPILTAHFGSS